jgi:hypothetical protein
MFCKNICFARIYDLSCYTQEYNIDTFDINNHLWTEEQVNEYYNNLSSTIDNSEEILEGYETKLEGKCPLCRRKRPLCRRKHI